MCGIVGLFLKNPSLEAQLGALLTDMLITMTDRGPDSAGIAIYGGERDGRAKLTVQSDTPDADFESIAETLGSAMGASVGISIKDTHAVLSVPSKQLASAREEISANHPTIRIMSRGECLEIYKEVLADVYVKALIPQTKIRLPLVLR